MPRFVTIASILVTLAGVLQNPATLAGKWQGETDGGASLALDLEVDGSVLSGTLERNGQATKLTDGKVTKNGIAFKATLNERTEAFSGRLEGEQLKVWLDRQGESKAVVLTRVKAK
jgi:hypothetical protein